MTPQIQAVAIMFAGLAIAAAFYGVAALLERITR